MFHRTLLIRNGRVVDGSGVPGFMADVGIRNGRIAEIGRLRGSARRVIDAQGLVVAPGFIDSHCHYDAQVLWDPMLTISPWHGVTTVVVGNCGFGIAPTRPEHRGLILRTLERVEAMSLAALEAGIGPDWPFVSFPEYMDALAARPLGINVAVLLGHTRSVAQRFSRSTETIARSGIDHSFLRWPRSGDDRSLH